jgi:hypothetical protein
VFFLSGIQLGIQADMNPRANAKWTSCLEPAGQASAQAQLMGRDLTKQEVTIPATMQGKQGKCEQRWYESLALSLFY